MTKSNFPTTATSKKVSLNNCDNDRQSEIENWPRKQEISFVSVVIEGHIAISGCRSLLQSFGDTFFEVVMVGSTPGLPLETNTFVVLLLKRVWAFLPPSATRMRKN